MLRLHRAERSSTLVVALAEVLTVPLPDPFTAEVVAVPAKGVERWLSQRLSGVLGAVTDDGVAANIDFPSPARLVGDVVATAAGVDPETDPWAAGPLLWNVLATIDASLDEPWCAVLAKHLGHGRDDHRAGRRYATAAHLTELFIRYAANRPGLLLDWAAGRDTDGAGSPLAPDLHWQAQLYRRLGERIDSPSPSARLAAACERLRAEPHLTDLPERVSLFGPTRLTTEQLTVLDALAEHRDVHIWLPHPSPSLWTSLVAAPPRLRRQPDDSAASIEHPLLASLSRDVRELQLRLAPLRASDTHHAGPPLPDTLLGRIQADIRDDRPPTAGVTPDATVQVHAAHGPARQVEVLREALLHLFQDDPTLEPRDVVVMCPDVETYAPLVRAAFGPGIPGHPGHRLRVRLADRALRQTNPLLDLVAAVVDLADGRVTASDVLDLAASSPVRRRFGFTDDDLERLREWTAQAGARWGIGPSQRAAYGLPKVAQNTWNSAVDRILVGVTSDETELDWLGLALPLDDVDSNDIDLAGRLAEFVDRLAVVLMSLQGRSPAAAWTTALDRALELLADVPASDAWQLAQARRELATATDHSSGLALTLADVRSMLATRLAGRPTRANFRTGELTVCTMVPMRSVPHRVVALLGLDDEIFPRGAGIDGDDVLARDPCLGERDPRSEDRQLLLDAVMSAREHLLVFYSGADPVSGASRPPAVPLSELLDVATTMIGSTEGVVTRHPLQPFDRRNFLSGIDGLRASGSLPFSFDRCALAGAKAAQRRAIDPAAFLPGPLPSTTGDVELGDLVAFLVHPTQGFLRQRLGVRIPQPDEDVNDALSVELDGLGKWDVGDRMLAARIAGVPLDALAQVERRRGSLPPLRLGGRVLDDIEQNVEALAMVSQAVHSGPVDTVHVSVTLPDGRRLTGGVPGVYGQVLASTSYSSLGPKHRLTAWVHLLAVAAARPGEWQAITTGRGRFRQRVARSTVTAPDRPLDVLQQLVDLRDRGLREPLPLVTGASCVYAERRQTGHDDAEALEAARMDFSDRFGDHTDRQLAYIYGRSPRFDQLESAVLADEKQWAPASTRFGVLALRMWKPLLELEKVTAP